MNGAFVTFCSYFPNIFYVMSIFFSSFFSSNHYVLFLWFNAIFQHNIGYTWWPVLMVEEEPRQPPERTTDPREATGKLSHITTLAESKTCTHTDRDEMAVIHNGQHFRPIGHSGPRNIPCMIES